MSTMKRTSKAPPKPAKLKPIPRFATEDEEREFWATAETSDYFDVSKAVWVTLPPDHPLRKVVRQQSTTTISLRLPDELLSHLREQADERDVPYQSLLKVYLADRVREEALKSYRARSVKGNPIKRVKKK